ncbi:MAG: 3-deoxy-D-manno-octulosonic acid transferase [Flavobacteriales bacterium]
MSLLYTLSIRLYGFFVSIAALVFKNPKAVKWLEGRKNLREQLKKQDLSGCIWMHCASLGEFEQGRSVLEGIAKANPDQKLLLTFFSPSGYEVRKNYNGADYVCYLPLDTRANAKWFLDEVQPSKVIFVKYEFWFNLLYELRSRKIDHFLISGIFRESQHFFKFYGAWFRQALHGFNTLFVQNEESAKLLADKGIESVLAGDTRFDRVHEVVQEATPVPLIEKFAGDSSVLVLGSSWLEDERLAAKITLPKNWKLLIVPHEVDSHHINEIKKIFEEALSFSDATMGNVSDCSVLVVDQIGLLSRIYRYASLAWIGGGFSAGVHNTLEAAAYGIPVVCGPNNSKFKEIQDLKSCDGLLEINKSDLANLDALIVDLQRMQSMGRNAQKYVNSKLGGSQLAIDAMGITKKKVSGLV